MYVCAIFVNICLYVLLWNPMNDYMASLYGTVENLGNLTCWYLNYYTYLGEASLFSWFASVVVRWLVQKRGGGDWWRAVDLPKCRRALGNIPMRAGQTKVSTFLATGIDCERISGSPVIPVSLSRLDVKCEYKFKGRMSPSPSDSFLCSLNTQTGSTCRFLFRRSHMRKTSSEKTIWTRGAARSAGRSTYYSFIFSGLDGTTNGM